MFERLRSQLGVSVCHGRGFSLAIPFLFLGSLSYAAHECSDKDVLLHFVHEGAKQRSLTTVELDDRQAFRICVDKTYPAAFDYLLHDVSALAAESAPRTAATGSLSSTLVPPATEPPKAHDIRFRGYILEIRRKTGAACPGDCEKLKDATLVIEVPDSPWQLETAGAFTASTLTNPRFYTTVEAGTTKLLQDEDAEDAARLGLAAFAHVRHRKLAAWNLLSFGLGVNDAGSTAYYFGTGVRLGSKASIVGGGVLGTVDRLPAGVRVGGTVMDPASLANLPKKTSLGWFVAFSFGFVGGGDALKKPFAPTPAPSPGK